MTRSAVDGEVSITVERCQSMAPDHAPRPVSVAVACDEYEHSLDDASAREVDRLLGKNDFNAAWLKQAEGARRLFSTGDQSWRLGDAKGAAWHVLEEQTRQWRLMPGADLKFDKCEDSSTDDAPIIMGCRWYSPDGTRTFDVSLLKERRATGKPQNAPCLVTGVGVGVCRPDKD